MDEPKKADQFNGSGNSNPGSSSGGVMDIQSSNKPAFDGAPALPVSDTPDAAGLENLETPSTVPLTPPNDTDFSQPSTASANEPPESSSPISEGADSTAAAAVNQTGTSSADSVASPAPNPLAIPPHATHKSKGPVVAIVVAIIVALALGGLVMFTFTKSKDNSAGTNSSAGPAPVVSKPLASPADVDATSQELENSLSKIDEDKDFSSEELSDKSLGL